MIRALTLSWMPFCATPWNVGVSMTFGVNRGLQRFEHVAAGQVDRRRALPLQRNLRALRGDHRQRDIFDVAAGQHVRLQLIDGERQARPCARARRFATIDAGRNADHAHPDQRADRKRHAGGDRADPQPEREVVQQQYQDDEDDGYQAEGEQRGEGDHVLFQLFGVGSLLGRTKIRAPSTRVTTSGVPAATNSPSVSTSTFCPSMAA